MKEYLFIFCEFYRLLQFNETLDKYFVLIQLQNQLEREAYRSPPENVNTNVNSTSRIDYSAREPPPVRMLIQTVCLMLN